MSTKELAEELHKPVIKKLIKRKVYSSFIDNIWHGDYATKADLNNATGADTWKFAKKVDWVSLKLKGGKIDIDKLEKYQLV